MSWADGKNRIPSSGELTKAIEERLKQIRKKAPPKQPSEILENLLPIQMQQIDSIKYQQRGLEEERDEDQSINAAIDRLMSDALNKLEDVNPYLADLLKMYYYKGWSDQTSIKNRKLEDSVATVRRHRIEKALPELAKTILAREISAREELQEALFQKLPAPVFGEVYGRTSEISQLSAEIVDSTHQWMLNVTGLGGIGKSTVVLKTIHHLIENEGLLFVEWIEIENQILAESAENLPEKIYQTILKSLRERLELPPVPPRLHERQVQAFLRQVPYLIVIDNLEITDANNFLVQKLQRFADPSRFILVSRHRLNSELIIRNFPIYELAAEDANLMVSHRSHQLGIKHLANANDDLLERIYKLVGGHPLAIRLFVKLAHYFNLEEVLTELELAEIDEIESLYHNIYHRVYQAQSDSARQLLFALRLAPKEGVTNEYLAAYCGLSKQERMRSIEQLDDSALLQKGRRQKLFFYKLHNLTNTFLEQLPSEISGVTDDQFDQQILAACAYWGEKRARKEIKSKNFAESHPYLYRLVQVGCTRPATWSAVTNLMTGFFLTISPTPYASDWLDLHYVALQRFNDVGLADRRDEFLPDLRRLYSRLGNFEHNEGALAESLDATQKALALAIELKDLKLQASGFNMLAILSRELGEPEDGLKFATDAVEIFEELSVKPDFLLAAFNTQGQNFYDIGLLSKASAAFKKASAAYHKALALASEDEKPPPPKTQLVRVLTNLGAVQKEMGDLQEANQSLMQAYEVAQETEASFDLHTSLTMLIQYYVDVGDLDSAEKIITESGINIEDHRITDPMAVRFWLEIGRYHYYRENSADAIFHLEEAVKLAVRATRPILQARAYAYLYRIHHKDEQLAKRFKQKARALFESHPSSYWVNKYQEKYSYIFR